jgi:hypothetical protein
MLAAISIGRRLPMNAKPPAAVTVHVPYTVERDEDGIWCGQAWLGSSGGANGTGTSRKQAIADLRDAVQMVLCEDGVPEQLRCSLRLRVGRTRQ